jgi:hypothetical protein
MSIVSSPQPFHRLTVLPLFLFTLCKKISHAAALVLRIHAKALFEHATDE